MQGSYFFKYFICKLYKTSDKESVVTDLRARYQSRRITEKIFALMSIYVGSSLLGTEYSKSMNHTFLSVMILPVVLGIL